MLRMKAVALGGLHLVQSRVHLAGVLCPGLFEAEIRDGLGVEVKHESQVTLTLAPKLRVVGYLPLKVSGLRGSRFTPSHVMHPWSCRDSTVRHSEFRKRVLRHSHVLPMTSFHRCLFFLIVICTIPFVV